MRRRLFNPLTVLSLLLCAAACALWARSYRMWHAAVYVGDRSAAEVAARRGLFFLAAGGGSDFPDREAGGRLRHLSGRVNATVHLRDWLPLHMGVPVWAYAETRPGERVPVHEFPGGFHLSAAKFYDNSARAIGVPAWCVVLVTAAAPVLRLRSVWSRRSRVNRGRCSACGYDLRATAGRCPECGQDNPAGISN